MAYDSSPSQIEGRIDPVINSDPRPPPPYNPSALQNEIQPNRQTPSHPVVPPVKINVKVCVQQSSAKNVLSEPFINEQYEPGSKSYDEALKHGDDEGSLVHSSQNISCLCAALRFFIWMTFGMGLATSIWWFICSLLVPCWHTACWRISKYLFIGQLTKSKEIRLHTKCGCYSSHGCCEQNCCCDAGAIMAWSCIFGLPSLMLHFLFTLWTFPFLIFGWKFALIHWRLCKVVLFNPHNVEIRDHQRPVHGEGMIN